MPPEQDPYEESNVTPQETVAAVSPANIKRLGRLAKDFDKEVSRTNPELAQEFRNRQHTIADAKNKGEAILRMRF